jgi:hypothetical protein
VNKEISIQTNKPDHDEGLFSFSFTVDVCTGDESPGFKSIPMAACLLKAPCPM